MLHVGAVVQDLVLFQTVEGREAMCQGRFLGLYRCIMVRPRDLGLKAPFSASRSPLLQADVVRDYAHLGLAVLSMLNA